jgi:hypothetical protein
MCTFVRWIPVYIFLLALCQVAFSQGFHTQSAEHLRGLTLTRSSIRPNIPSLTAVTTTTIPITVTTKTEKSHINMQQPFALLPKSTAANLEKDCALLFFGLAKKFKKLVLPSIRKYILNYNPNCDIYAHTYDLHKITNPRNGEKNNVVHPLEVYSLTNNVVLDTLESVSKVRNFEYYHKFSLDFTPSPYHTIGPISMDNMIKEWHSIERVWNSTKPFKYKRVGLFRLDVQYQEPIIITNGDAVVPNFEDFGYVNDRAFYGLYKWAKIWALTRFHQVEAQAKRNQNDLMAEKFLAYVLRDVPYEKKSMCFWRVRANGKIKNQDCQPTSKLLVRSKARLKKTQLKKNSN